MMSAKEAECAVSREIKELPTEEYGTLKCEVWTLAEVDALTKLRNDYVKFLGIYTMDGDRYIVFFVQNKTVMAAF